MIRDHDEIDRLRRAFAAGSREAAEGFECPTGDELWGALHGELPRARARRVIDHLVRCPACGEDWRLARELADERNVAAERAYWLRSGTLAAAAGAALVAAGLGLALFPWAAGPGGGASPGTVPSYRSATSPLRSLLPPGTALSRERPELRWSSAGEGAVYALEVRSEDLSTVLFKAEHLTAESLVLPAEVLAHLPAGSRVVWRVTAHLPDEPKPVTASFYQAIE